MIANLDSVQAADRDGREVRRLPGGRVLRQGQRRPVLGQRPVRRLHDRRLPDLAVRPGRLDRRPERVHLRLRPRPTRTTTGTTCCRTCAPRPPGRACRSRRSAATAPSSGRSHGASSSTRSPTTASTSTISASSSPRTCRSWSSRRRRSPTPARAVYGIGVRGSRSWATIHPGYLSAFANYGASDFDVDGRQGQGGDEQRRRQGDDRALGQDDPGGRARRTGPPTPGTRSAPTSVPAPRR